MVIKTNGRFKLGKPRKAKVVTPLKLDLGCGENCIEGFTGVDLYAPSAKIKADLFKLPWPWKDGSVDELHASHFIEHIPQNLRWPFFEECYRVLKLDGVMRIIVPNWKSERAYGDMTHQWPPVTAMFFYYLHKGWREQNKLTYGAYDIKTNFDHQAGPTAMNPEFAQRAQDVQMFSASHYTESYGDMWVTITKRPM